MARPESEYNQEQQRNAKPWGGTATIVERGELPYERGAGVASETTIFTMKLATGEPPTMAQLDAYVMEQEEPGKFRPYYTQPQTRPAILRTRGPELPASPTVEQKPDKTKKKGNKK